MTDTTAEKGRGRLYLFAAALILFAVFAQVVFFKYGSPLTNQPASSRLKINATILPEAGPLPAFVLQDQHGKAFSQDDLRGRWTLMAFGYTSCPDVCPELLNTFKRVDGLLGGAAFEYPPNYVFITVDPERDTIARLAEFIPHFDENIIGLTGDRQQIEKLTRGLGIMNLKVENPGELEPIVSPQDAAGHEHHQPAGQQDNYLIDHTAAILIINPDGELHALTSPPHSGDVIARDYRNIVSLAAIRASARQ